MQSRQPIRIRPGSGTQDYFELPSIGVCSAALGPAIFATALVGNGIGYKPMHASVLHVHDQAVQVHACHLTDQSFLALPATFLPVPLCM